MIVAPMPIALMIARQPHWCPMCSADGRWGHGMMFAPMLLWLVLLAVASVLAWRLAVARRGPPPAPPGPSAAQILDERYARGEIDRETYLRMRGDLGPPPFQ